MTNIFQRPIRPVIKSMPGPSDLHVPTGKLTPVRGSKRKPKGRACPSSM